MSRFLEVSKFYHSLGWSVIPIIKNSKLPVFNLLSKGVDGKGFILVPAEKVKND